MTFFFELVDDSDDEAEADESARRQDKHQDVGGLRQDAEAEDGAAAQELTDAAQQRQGEREAQTHAEAIQTRREDGVLRGESLSATQHDAVHHDQGDEQAERLVNIRDESLHHQLYHRHKRGDDHDEAGDTHLVGDEAFQQGDEDVGKDKYEGRGQTHRHAVDGAGRRSQGRATAQQQDQDGVFFDETFGEGLQVVTHFQFLLPHFRFLPPYRLQRRKRSCYTFLCWPQRLGRPCQPPLRKLSR